MTGFVNSPQPTKRLQIKTDAGSQSFSNIRLDATDAQILHFAKRIQNLKKDPLTSATVTTTQSITLDMD